MKRKELTIMTFIMISKLKYPFGLHGLTNVNFAQC